MGSDVTLTADQAINAVFSKCGHRHELAKGDREHREPIQAGETFSLPAECAAALLSWAYPADNNASVSSSGRGVGLIAGLRVLEE